jgi:hypothetical protein
METEVEERTSAPPEGAEAEAGGETASQALSDLDDIEFVLEEIENKIAPLALA